MQLKMIPNNKQSMYDKENFGKCEWPLKKRGGGGSVHHLIAFPQFLAIHDFKINITNDD